MEKIPKENLEKFKNQIKSNVKVRELEFIEYIPSPHQEKAIAVEFNFKLPTDPSIAYEILEVLEKTIKYYLKNLHEDFQIPKHYLEKVYYEKEVFNNWYSIVVRLPIDKKAIGQKLGKFIKEKFEEIILKITRGSLEKRKIDEILEKIQKDLK